MYGVVLPVEGRRMGLGVRWRVALPHNHQNRHKKALQSIVSYA